MIIIGAGGHGLALIQACYPTGIAEGCAYYFLDEDPALADTFTESGVMIYGSIKDIVRSNSFTQLAANGIGNKPRVGDSGLMKRAEIYCSWVARGFKFPVWLSDHRSGHITLGDGVQVFPTAYVARAAKVDVNTIINTGAIVEHGCVVGAHCHLAPRATLLGNVRVGNMVHVGAGAVIRQGVTIGPGAVIGMGAVVTEDVPAYATVFGPRSTVRLATRA